MFAQTGAFDEREMRGLIIRLLVLPDDIAGLWETLCFIALELSPNIPISLMSQYSPESCSMQVKELSRTITNAEYRQAISMTEELGFETVYIQDMRSPNEYVPDFTRKENPFGR